MQNDDELEDILVDDVIDEMDDDEVYDGIEIGYIIVDEIELIDNEIIDETPVLRDVLVDDDEGDILQPDVLEVVMLDDIEFESDEMDEIEYRQI